jgi:hypothetical protein
MPVVLNWLESWGAPLFASVVSIIYFRSSPRAQALWERVTVSAHGASIAALYFGAMSIWWAGASRSSFATPFALASVLPVALSSRFIRFRGQRTVHFLQTVNLLCFIWTLFVGSMAVTGDRLRWALTNRWSQLRKN